jgi:hypothetical protein
MVFNISCILKLILCTGHVIYPHSGDESEEIDEQNPENPNLDPIGPIMGPIAPILDAVGPIMGPIAPILDAVGPILDAVDPLLEQHEDPLLAPHGKVWTEVDSINVDPSAGNIYDKESVLRWNQVEFYMLTLPSRQSILAMSLLLMEYISWDV